MLFLQTVPMRSKFQPVVETNFVLKLYWQVFDSFISCLIIKKIIKYLCDICTWMYICIIHNISQGYFRDWVYFKGFFLIFPLFGENDQVPNLHHRLKSVGEKWRRPAYSLSVFLYLNVSFSLFDSASISLFSFFNSYSHFLCPFLVLVPIES